MAGRFGMLGSIAGPVSPRMPQGAAKPKPRNVCVEKSRRRAGAGRLLASRVVWTSGRWSARGPCVGTVASFGNQSLARRIGTVRVDPARRIGREFNRLLGNRARPFILRYFRCWYPSANCTSVSGYRLRARGVPSVMGGPPVRSKRYENKAWRVFWLVRLDAWRLNGHSKSRYAVFSGSGFGPTHAG